MGAIQNWQTIEAAERAGKIRDFVLSRCGVSAQEVADATGLSVTIANKRLNEFLSAGVLSRIQQPGRMPGGGSFPCMWVAYAWSPSPADPIHDDAERVDVESFFHGRKVSPAVQIGIPRHWLDVALFGAWSAA